MTGYIYKITNKINNKIYIGYHSATSIKPDSYMGSGLLIKKAILKYGLSNFTKDIIDICDNESEWKDKEKYWIATLNSIQPQGYNISLGGNGGDTISKNPNRNKIIKQISISTSGSRNHFFRKKHKKETIEKNRQSNKILYKNGYINPFQDKHHTEETKRKISDACRGKKSVWFGKKHSQKTKDKMRESAIKRWQLKTQRENYNETREG